MESSPSEPAEMVVWPNIISVGEVFVELFRNRSVLGSESAFFAALIAVLAIVIGAGYLLHDSRRSVESIAST